MMMCQILFSDWTSEFAGQWEDDRTADEVIEDIRGARTSNREIQQ